MTYTELRALKWSFEMLQDDDHDCKLATKNCCEVCENLYALSKLIKRNELALNMGSFKI